MSICPHCGSQTDKVLFIPHTFGGVERAVVAALPHEGEGLTLDELVHRVYGVRAYSTTGRNGTTDQRRGVLTVILHRLRKKLPALGWTIPPVGGHKGTVARYRLEKL